MSVEIRHNINPALAPLLAYLNAQQSAAPQPGRATAPQANPILDAMNAAAMRAMPGGGYPQAGQPMAPAAPPQAQRPEQRTSPAAANWLNQQMNQAGDFLKDYMGNVAGVQKAQIGAQERIALDQQNADQALIAKQSELQTGMQMKAYEQDIARYNAAMKDNPAMLDPESMAEAQRKIQANRQALSAPAQAARFELMQKIAAGDPQAIQQGVAQGLLQFSPEQKTRIRQLREGMAAIDSDDRLTLQEKAAGRAQLAEQLQAIRPMEVPIDQLPVDPIEQFHKDTLTIPHDSGGPPRTYKKTFRNGVEGWELTEDSQLEQKRWNDQQLEKWKKENGIGEKDPKLVQMEIDANRQKNQVAMHKLNMEAKTKALQSLIDLQVGIATARQNLATAQATPDATDDTAAQAQLDFILQQIPIIQQQIAGYDIALQQAMDGINQIPGMVDETAPQPYAGMDMGGMPPQGDTSESQYMAPTPTMPPPIPPGQMPMPQVTPPEGGAQTLPLPMTPGQPPPQPEPLPPAGPIKPEDAVPLSQGNKPDWRSFKHTRTQDDLMRADGEAIYNGIKLPTYYGQPIASNYSEVDAIPDGVQFTGKDGKSAVKRNGKIDAYTESYSTINIDSPEEVDKYVAGTWFTYPDGTVFQSPLSSERKEGKTQWAETKIGEIITLPDGRVVKKISEKDFVRVQ